MASLMDILKIHVKSNHYNYISIYINDPQTYTNIVKKLKNISLYPGHMDQPFYYIYSNMIIYNHY